MGAQSIGSDTPVWSTSVPGGLLASIPEPQVGLMPLDGPAPVDSLNRVKRSFGAIWVYAAIPFVTLFTANRGSPLPILKLVSYWLLIGSTVSLVAYLSVRFSTRKSPRVATFLALSLYVLGSLAVRVAESLPRAPSRELVVLVTLGLLILSWFTTRWRWSADYVLFLGLALLLVPPLTTAISRPAPASAAPALPTAQPLHLGPRATPNIYWIVLDGLAGPPILREYGYEDYEVFEGELVDRGFEVSENTVAAYTMSYLSISSTLSMRYIAGERDSVGQMDPFFKVVQGNNRLVATLRDWGYRFILVPGDGWTGSQCAGWEDVCVDSAHHSESDLVLVGMTPFAWAWDTAYRAREHAAASNPIMAVESALEVDGYSPRFTMIHLINPHPPYFELGPECTINTNVTFNLVSDWNPPHTYVDAVRCLAERLPPALDRIIESDPEAIIVVQGDHGPDTGIGLAQDVALNQWDPDDIRIRLSAFSAIRAGRSCTFPVLNTLVNTFRQVLDCLSREDVQALPVRTWVGNLVPGELREVTYPHKQASRSIRQSKATTNWGN